jgi:hypothetical protein
MSKIKPISKNKFRILCRSIIQQVVSKNDNVSWKTISILLGEDNSHKIEICNDLYSYGGAQTNIRLRYDLMEKYKCYEIYSYRYTENTFDSVYSRLKDLELLNGLDFVLEEQIMLEL